MAQMALATQKQKHTNTSTKSSTWYTQHGNREPAWRSTFLITLTRAVHMLGMCFAHECALVRMCLIRLCYDQVFWCRRDHVYCLIFNIILRRPHVFWHPLIVHHISHCKQIQMQHIFHFHFSFVHLYLYKQKLKTCISLDRINPYYQTRTKQNVSFSYNEKSWRIWILKTSTLSWWDFLQFLVNGIMTVAWAKGH